MNEPNNHTNGQSGAPASHEGEPVEEEVSVIEILLVLARNRTLIVAAIVVCGALGLVLALTASAEYTASAQLIREVENEGAMRNFSGLSLLRGLGISLGGATTGLTAEAYPNLTRSREVRLAVVRDTFYFSDLDSTLTYVAYVHRAPGMWVVVKDYTIGLPWRIREALRSEPPRPPLSGLAGGPVYPSEEEEIAMKAVDELIDVASDLETGLMTISATTEDPVFSAQLTASFVRHLAKRVREIKTQKASENLTFIQERFELVRAELERAEDILALFDDRNTNIQSARLRAEREQLQRQVSFKEELYSELQAELTQAEIELQRSKPILTVIEEPVPPVKPSGPKRTLMLAVSLFLGALVGIGLAFVRAFFQRQGSDEAGRSKLNELRSAITPPAAVRERWARWRRRREAKAGASDVEEG